MTEHDRLAEAREALERITDYFDQRADAEAVGDPARYQGNREMHLRRDAETVAAALAAARADGAAEAFERATAEVHRWVDVYAQAASKCPTQRGKQFRLGIHAALSDAAAAIRALAEKERGA